MMNSYLPEWFVETRPNEKTGSLLHWSQELGVSQQELRSALSSTSASMNAADTPAASERRQRVERRRDGRRRGD
jgi:hypothetical protein